MAAITTSALMVSCAAVANLLDHYPDLVDLADFGAPAHQSSTHDANARDTPASFAVLRLEGPAQRAEPVRLAIPPAGANLPAPDLAHLVTPSAAGANVLGLDTNYDLSTPLALDAHAVSFDEAGRLMLHTPASATQQRQSNGGGTDASDAQTNAGLRERLQDFGHTLVSDWQAPPRQQSDVALFVAADDETLSWALNRTSPNHGALAYADDQVELGERAVGVSISLGETRFAAAYVEREYKAPFRGARGAEESFAGLTLTYRN
ncbi:MAG: hypothetical protein M0D54_18035 [Hyphomonadaceae bacterium JAD_PAG50586_4]|nr:MAG: hypothetical protein M0D54_18035 [Hyphomonadaceae bacterium JAD_PAG50586_4]